jgi:hypothetical protein
VEVIHLGAEGCQNVFRGRARLKDTDAGLQLDKGGIVHLPRGPGRVVCCADAVAEFHQFFVKFPS